MDKKSQIKKLFQSFVFVPILATALPFNMYTANIAMIATESTENATVSTEDYNKVLREERAAKIDEYFEKRDMPLAGYGMKMVLEAEKNDIPWNLIPAIAVRESTGGKFACKSVSYSAFGWGSCKISFESYDHAIESLATNLGGNNPKTAKYYANKSVEQILKTYNPPSIVPKYSNQVIAIMDAIENEG